MKRTEMLGLEQLDHLGSTAGSDLYRAQLLQDRDQVLIKRCMAAQEERFRREYAILQNLSISSVPRPIELLHEYDSLIIVLEHVPGVSFESYLTQHRLDLLVALRLACQATRILADMHAEDLTHHDVRPANFLFDPEKAQLILVDFSFAGPDTKHIALGTELGDWAYISPEQTGRTNRIIDYRTDFYSLGVMLYRMLTGQLPIQGNDLLEFMHGHVARLPVAPIAIVPQLPIMVSDLVLRLLAKLPEDRYQSAHGLLADLERCCFECESTGKIPFFVLGTRDVPERFHIAHKLYGRDGDIQTLLNAFEHMARTGQVTLVTVTGQAGIGKSSLVQELHRPIMERHGYFISGKFDQYRHDTPYGTLPQAFQDLVQRVLAESEERIENWRRKILRAVGIYGQIIIDILPQVELIIGKQAPVAPLPPVEARYRFQRILRRFLGVFASKEQPLVICLDDLQWIDTAGLYVIEHILSHPHNRYIMMVWTFRDNEVTPFHPLSASLERIRRAGVLTHDIALMSPSAAELNRLVVDTLHAESTACEPLTQLIHERTGGNPFFFTQFFHGLHSEGLLWYDPHDYVWAWDLGQIQAKNFADNAVDFVVRKLNLLPPEVQDLLRLASCLGNKFELRQLALISRDTHEDMERCLAVALDASLITYTDESCKFLHDRIQQAVYSLVSEDDRPALHLRIGHLLLEHFPEGVEGAPLYDIASQLNRGAAAIVEWQEKVQTAQVNLRAGRQIMASAAYATASKLFASGIDLLGEEGWDIEHALTFELNVERAYCEFAIGNFQETEHLISIGLQHAVSPVERAVVDCQKLRLHFLRSEIREAVEHALTCLHAFGIDLPAHPTEDDVEQAYVEVQRLLDGSSIDSLRDLPLMTDPEVRAAMRILAVVLTAAYYTDPHLNALLSCQMTKLSMQHGNCEESAFGYTSLGAILGPFFRRYLDGYSFTKLSCDLTEQNDFVAFKGKVYLGAQMAALWVQSVPDAIALVRTAYRASNESGDLICACIAQYHIVVDRLLRGDPLDDVWRESEDALTFVRRAKSQGVADGIVVQQCFIAAMQGRTPEFPAFCPTPAEEEVFDAAMTRGRPDMMIFRYLTTLLQARFLAGDYALALAASERAKAYLWNSLISIHTLHYYYYTALTIAALYDNEESEQQRAWRKLLTEHAQQLGEWSQHNPSTFEDKYLLVCAEIARIDNNDLQAIHLYQRAIDAATRNGFSYHEGTAHEAAARFYHMRGLPTSGHAHLQAARHCYLRWGAHGKVRQLDMSLPEKMHMVPTPEATPEDTVKLDMLSVIKASQAVSGRIVLDELLETLMRIVVESAGAQKGCLLLMHNGAWILAADARIDQIIDIRLHLTHPPADVALPNSMINYTRRTKEQVLLPDATQPSSFSDDPYFSQYQVRSAWCMPIRYQDTLLGILYLEHSLISHVFTPDRQAMLELLAAQAAISLENALLYANLTQENSERKAAEAALRQAHDELEERVRERTEALARSNADLEQFAYVASHDLQEPLRMVTGYLQLLEQRYRDRLDSEANDFIAFAVNGAIRMQNLIKDLLTYARLETKGKSWKIVDCQVMMKVVQNSLKMAIDESGAQIEFSALPQIIGEETQLMQLFQNLIANAIKFRGNSSPRILIHAEPEADRWHFSVQDNGIGIAPEHFERIFKMFQRLHSRNTYPGTGIGLALCKRIVERHGGHIGVESSGSGSIFHFDLPGVHNH